MPAGPSALRRLLPSPRDLPGDALAGGVNAVVSVPSGMATAAIAGVSPVHGLYATLAAPTAGGLFASSQLMQIATTGVSAITAGQAVAHLPEDQRPAGLFLLVLLAGIFLIGFGLLKAGRLVRYVSYPVMTAFLSGVAAVLVLDQAMQLLGLTSQAGTSFGVAADLVAGIGGAHLATVLLGLLALGLMLGLQRTPLAQVASLVALVVPTAVALLWKPQGVDLVRDVSEIPSGLPPVSLPDLSLMTPSLVGSAFAVAVVVALQGAGVSAGIPNPDGSRADTSQDMLAQGVGNAASGLLSGMPTGASVSQSALNTQVGARSRWAMVFHGLAMLLIILVAAGLVSLVPMTVLAGIMIVAGAGAFKLEAMRSIWRVGGTGRWAMVLTFLATLLTSIPVAVGLGVLLTLALFIARSGQSVEVHELVELDDGRRRRDPVPAELSDGQVTVLETVGPLHFAAARTLREDLPAVGQARGAAVVLRVRGGRQIGSTFLDEMSGYARRLAEQDGRLFICGLDESAVRDLRRSDALRGADHLELVPGSRIVGGSLREAVERARSWTADHRGQRLADRPGGAGER